MSAESWLNRVWYERAGPPWWLMPLSLLYGAVSGSRRFLYAKRLRRSTRLARPVIMPEPTRSVSHLPVFTQAAARPDFDYRAAIS